MRTFSVVLTLLLPLAVSAQDNVFTPQHVAKLRIVTEAVISPDGTQVAYILSVPRDLAKEKDGPSWTELRVVDTKGNQAPFITGQVNIGNIGWTPDGKQIAFLAKRGKDAHKALYVIGAKGGEARKLITHGADILGYSFSGDGKQIAFLATEPTTKAKKAQQDQGFNQEVYEEDQPFVRVWLASLPRQRGEEAKMLDLKGSASELHFNPKEDKLAVALAPSPGIDDHIMFRKVHIVELNLASLGRKPGEDAKDAKDTKTPPANAGGSLVKKITNLNNPGKLGQLAWSPDGKKLAMITGADKHDPWPGRLWIFGSDLHSAENGLVKADIDLDNSASFFRPGHHVESVVWHGHKVSYVVSAGTGSCVPWYENTGTGVGTGISNGHWTIPGWAEMSSLSISADGKAMAVIGHRRNHPPEVYIFDMTKGRESEKIPARLTDSNPWLKDMKFAKQEVIKYKAKDGLELEGILIYPLNYEKGKRYPLILNVHGGPEAHYSNGWITNYNALGQVAAAKGMAVFYPNYRGSTGYGVEFSMKGQKDAGGKEFDDLIDGVDHLVKMGLVDDKKVGITGGSYGGYATAWGATFYSHRFAAGVMFVGISDWISCAGTTDIPHEMNLVHHRKWLWDDWDYFKKASPLNYLNKAKTPLLIMHGKADPRVNPGQSLELYRHLKVRNQAPVRLVLYPGEGHGNRRAASRLDYNIRALQWMEHYLKGPGGKMPPMEIDYGLKTAPQKTSSLGWNDGAPLATTHEPWLGGGCPCCIGW